MDKKTTTASKKTVTKTTTTKSASKAGARSGASSKASTTTKRSTAKGQKSHVGAWIAGGVGIAAVIAMIVLACILIPKMGKPDYGESYKVANELDEKLGEAYDGYDAVCYKMLVKTADTDLDMAAYNEATDKCKVAVDESRELTKKLGRTTGITKNEDLKKQFETYEQATAEGLPEASTLDIYRRLHEFLLNSQDISVDSSKEDVEKAAEPLTKSGNQTWEDFGKGWSDRTIKLIESYAAYDQADETASNYRELYNNYQDAMEDLDEFSDDFDVDDAAVGGIDADKINDMLDKFDDLRSAIRDTYEQNYDDKNTDECVKADDGSVTCR